ncbi:MAG: peptidylprolyl isomerase, partial [Gemmatimonadaceae bacterium]
DKGKFNGLTFHRIVANFVIQGGSPGADEYDGITAQFEKDEVGLPSHLRGTLGISTRGHDTGDGQIFVNLIDNFRLDHQYTVFARITSGMDVVDRVQEGDVMETVQIIRRR